MMMMMIMIKMVMIMMMIMMIIMMIMMMIKMVMIMMMMMMMMIKITIMMMIMMIVIMMMMMMKFIFLVKLKEGSGLQNLLSTCPRLTYRYSQQNMTKGHKRSRNMKHNHDTSNMESIIFVSPSSKGTMKRLGTNMFPYID
jgi:hypothetical protein